MTLGGAITTVYEILEGGQPTSITDRRGAMMIAIQAMKREQRRREFVSYHSDDMFVQLPGETKE